MNYLLMHAIGEYLRDCGDLPPLPLIDLTPEKYRNWQGGEFPLLDEADLMLIHAPTEQPEPDCLLAFTSEHHWSRYKARMRDEQPTFKVLALPTR